MATHPYELIRVVFVLSAMVFAGSVSLSVIAITRRLKRERDLKALDRSRDYVQSILMRILDDTLDYSSGLGLLRDTVANGNYRMAEQLLFERQASPKCLPILRNLAQDLGLIREWQSRLEEPALDRMQHFHFYCQRFLKRFRLLAFLARARNADRLGRVYHHASWQLLAKALNDPNGDVQAVALRSLANIGEARSFPFLIERVRAAASSAASLSERELTAALARFPPDMAHHLSPLLEESNPRLRLVAVNVLREMARVQAMLRKDLFTPDQFGREVSNSILTRLPEDEDANIRAGAADLLGYFRQEDRAWQGLVRLMRDGEWYVRLHAVRAAGQLAGSEWVLRVSACLTDPNWRVREAAAHALAGCRPAGVSYLLHTLLRTEDTYAREQILEELETSGIAADLTTHYGETAYELETKAVNAMAKMGRVNLSPQTPSKRIAVQERKG